MGYMHMLRNIHCLVVLSPHQHLLLPVYDVSSALWDGLVLQLLLGYDACPV